MANRFYIGRIIMVALLLVPSIIVAQEENSATNLKEFDWVDICENPKYAIVTKDDKQGVYDLELHKKVTEVEFNAVGYSRPGVEDDSIRADWFYAKKGIKRGLLCVFEGNNSIMSIWMDDPDEVYDLDECFTVDKKISKRAMKQLKAFLKKQQMENVQIVVQDARTGLMKTWVRVDRDMNREEAGKLLKHSCASSLLKPFYAIMAMEKRGLTLDSICNGVSYREAIRRVNDEVIHQALIKGFTRSAEERRWREITDTRNPYLNPLIIAAGFNSIVNNGMVMTPTLHGDSLEIEEDVFSPSQVESLMDVLKVDRIVSPHLAWLPTETEWLGYASMENLFADDDKEGTMPIGKQIQFACVFPAEAPRYTICIVADKLSMDVTPAVFKDVVNPLTKWLLKN